MNKAENMDSISERLKPGVNIVGDTVPLGMQRFVMHIRIRNLSGMRNFMKVSSIHDETKVVEKKYLTAVESMDVEDFPNVPISDDSYFFKIGSMTRFQIEADYDAFVFIKFYDW